MSNEHITSEFSNIKQKLKIPFYYNVKELYLNKNQIKDVTFIQYMNGLQILNISNFLLKF